MSPSSRFPAVASALLAAMSVAPTVSALDDSTFNYKTTKDLIEVCSADQGSAIFACRAFIAATMQYHDEISDRKKMKRLVCYPAGATVASGRDALLAWGKKNADNAKRMNELPVIGVVRSLAEAYPCK
ncbi:MAG TPA: Rap1a/Tai family immunity protein [Lamprocystis sp. (in: g-proteobacteria)]|nr:Rap1a/Tai family immunity protein [Lamprocystis sp. (in: g-proteobacteria)]